MENRNYSYDVIRSMAIFLVIWIHSQEQYPSDSSYFGSVTYYLGRLGVPLFLMLTGALQTSKAGSMSLKEYYRKKVLPLYLVSVVWIFLYAFNWGSANFASVFQNLVRAVCLITSTKHLWYLPIIIGISAIMPLISKIESMSNQDVFIISAMSFGFNILAMKNLFTVVQVQFGITYFMWYILVGYLCGKRKVLQTINIYLLIILNIGCVILFQLFRSWLVSANVTFDTWWYNMPFIMLGGVFLFELLQRIRIGNPTVIKGFAYISKNAFCMYLVHYFFVVLLGGILTAQLPKNAPIAVMICAGTFGLSFLSAIIISRIPVIRKIFLA